MRNVYLLCNAHIDPMWLWEWEEGAAAAVSTFRSAVSFCEEYNTFVFNHNEVLLYKWIEEYEPELFERIKIQVNRGNWNIMGGWYLQPDCVMPSGEGLVRQITTGNNYFKEKFGKEFKTAINFDSFGHSRGLAQIMRKCGYENYLVCRPSKNDINLPNEFEWKGFDGSSIHVCKHYELYNSALGKASEKIENLIKEKDDDNLLILWGVGNHGGGPSKKDIDDINQLIKKYLEIGVSIKHSTPDEYFEAKKNVQLPVVDYSLTPCNTGCYSSQIRIKQKYRELENQLFLTEKMLCVAEINGLLTYPKEQMMEVVNDMLLAQFHDILPGTAIQPVEQAGLRCIEHGLEILSKMRAKAFFKLSKGIKVEPNSYPVLVFNPHPYEIDWTGMCEFQLKDQNWNNNFTFMDVFQNGEKVNSQIEKEYCNLNLDWRKRVVIDARLKPMQMNLFTCKPYMVEKKQTFKQITGVWTFSSKEYKAEIDAKKGYLSLFNTNGENIASNIVATVHADNEDPWAMQPYQNKELGEKIGCFELMTDNEAKDFSNIKTKLQAVRMIEDGSVRTVIEVLQKYNKSDMAIKYIFYKEKPMIDLEITVYWNEKDKTLKLELPLKEPIQFLGDTAYGVDNLSQAGGEVVFQKWCRAEMKDTSFSVINNCIYAGAMMDNTLMLTLLRSPAYSGHPINDREILHQDRFTPRMEQGERNFSFSILMNKNIADVQKQAQVFNEKPFALSFFPLGDGEKIEQLIELDNDKILLTALKPACDDNGYIIRLFNSVNQEVNCALKISKYNIENSITFQPYEIITFRLDNGELTKNTLNENK